MNAAAVRADSQSSPAPGLHKQEGRARVLAICTVDVMAWKLLRPCSGPLPMTYEVHIACSSTQWFDQLAADGFHMHEVPLRRRLTPRAHRATLGALSADPAGALHAREHPQPRGGRGRPAGSLARPSTGNHLRGSRLLLPRDIPRWKRRCYVALERLLGRITDGFMFVSDEDRQQRLW